MKKNSLYPLFSCLLCSLFFVFSSCSHVKKAYFALSKSQAPETVESLDLGKEIYLKNCQSCHGLSGKGDGVLANDLRKALPDFSSTEWKEAKGITASHVYYGKGVMPSFKNRLSEKEIWSVTHYVHSLKKQN